MGMRGDTRAQERRMVRELTHRRAAPAGQATRSWLLRAAMFAVLWWAFAEGRPLSPLFAVVGIAAATASSMALLPPCRWRLRGVAAFAPFFVRQSLSGAVDVSMRALLPWRTVRPGYVTRRLALTDPHAIMLFTGAISLLPGTLSVRVTGREIMVHLVDVDTAPHASLDRLEQLVKGVVPAASTYDQPG